MDQYLPVDYTEVVDFPKFPATLQGTWDMYTQILANFFFRKFLFLSILFLEFYTVLEFFLVHVLEKKFLYQVHMYKPSYYFMEAFSCHVFAVYLLGIQRR